jgi:purine-binding chemotaxis protein CheW
VSATHGTTLETGAKYCTMAVGPHQFGIQVAQIQEILRDLKTTPVPRAPEVVRGLINLRGEIVTAVCLATRLGLTQDEGDGRTHIVLRTSDGVFSLIVDAVGDVVPVDEATVEAPPPNLDPLLADYVNGVFELETGLVSVLDVAAVLDIDGLN